MFQVRVNAIRASVDHCRRRLSPLVHRGYVLTSLSSFVARACIVLLVSVRPLEKMISPKN